MILASLNIGNEGLGSTIFSCVRPLSSHQLQEISPSKDHQLQKGSKKRDKFVVEEGYQIRSVLHYILPGRSRILENLS